MSYKPFPDAVSCTNAAEAVGRLYCASKSKPWPEAPDFYTTGLQPQPPAAFYQKYWQTPLAASGPTAQDPQAPVLPIRMQADAFCIAQQGKVVSTTGGNVTLDFSGLVADPVIATAQSAQTGT